MEYLCVKNWEEFQQYKDRDPKWIKVHRDLLYDYEFDNLDELCQMHLVKIWLLAAKIDNKIPNDAVWIGRQIGAKSKVDLKQLCTAGFLVMYESVQDCTEVYLEAEAETYKEETEKSKAPRKRGCRIPDDWKPDEVLVSWALIENPGIDLKKTIDSFTDYWRAKAGSAAVKLDWDATFRNWVRRQDVNSGNTNRPRESSVQRSERIEREHFAKLGINLP